jgi:octaprenyl-diphosphate synthase
MQAVKTTTAERSTDLVSRVRERIAGRLERNVLSSGGLVDVLQLMPGKMLRTRLAGRLSSCGSPPLTASALESICAATELVHTASLCHDDVIDGGLVRRFRPALWRSAGAPAAVLIGDMLLCEAMELLLEMGGNRHTLDFVTKVREVCAAEVEQEFLLRGRTPDAGTCIRVARQKTGPLFAFLARACGGEDRALSSSLEEAGYCVGTAYQLADNVLDVSGRERAAGKTLGTDAGRGKLTLAARPAHQGRGTALDCIAERCRAALQQVTAWPEAHEGLVWFLRCDLQPVLRRHGQDLADCVDSTL